MKRLQDIFIFGNNKQWSFDCSIYSHFSVFNAYIEHLALAIHYYRWETWHYYFSLIFQCSSNLSSYTWCGRWCILVIQTDSLSVYSSTQTNNVYQFPDINKSEHLNTKSMRWFLSIFNIIAAMRYNEHNSCVGFGPIHDRVQIYRSHIIEKHIGQACTKNQRPKMYQLITL